MVQINLSNKVFYTLITIIILITVVGIAYAYDTGLAPSVMGHSLEELGIQGSGYSIFVMPSGDSYKDCKTTCNEQMQILSSDSSTPTCFSYTNGEKMDLWEPCPSGKVECGRDFSGGTIPRIYLFCAKKETLAAKNMGEIIIQPASRWVVK